MDRPQIVVFNVLPTVLAHYERALVSELRDATGGHVDVHQMSIERQSVPSRVRRMARFLQACWQLRTVAGPLVVAWPAFGVAEPVLWRLLRRRGETFVIIHDPLSLRTGRHWPLPLHRAIARLGRSSRVRVITHSRGARQDLERMGWLVWANLGHPSLVADEPADASAQPSVLVLGQFKASRDVDTLTRIGQRIPDLGLVAVIRGRGWPTISGWHTDDRFLPEEELRQSLRKAACVLMPYSRYYQSGVAVRALELGVPVVGEPTDFLLELLGPTWPGLVRGTDATDWLQAIASVSQPHVRLEAIQRLRDARHRDIRCWSRVLS